VGESFWDKYFLSFANVIAESSRCLARKVGAIIVRDKSIISTGKNGPPRGVPHCNTRYYNDYNLIEEFKKLNCDTSKIPDKNICPRKLAGFKSGEGLEWCIASHGERSAIVNAAREGVSVKGATLFLSDCGVMCCTPCLIEIINSGIIEVVTTTPDKYYDIMGEWLVKNSGLIVRRYKIGD
jgi:dCMP deaminase